jgi:hypothetical protein
MGLTYDELVEALLQTAVVSPVAIAHLAPHPIHPLIQIQQNVPQTTLSV